MASEKRVVFRSTWLPWALLLPQVAVIGVFFFWPAAQAVWQSMLQQDAFGTSVEWVGLENFRALFADPGYLASFKTTAVFSLLVAVFGLALALLLALLMTFFFLRGGRTWWRGAMDRLPATRRAPIAEAGSRAVDVLAGYMLGTAVISAFGGITSGLIMVILGLPLALPIAVLGFFAGFIPYVGSFLSTAMAFLVAVALGTTSDIVLMGIFTVVFNIAQGNFVTPLVYGKSLSLHPAVVLMAIPVGQEVAGILGMFLLVPAAAMVAATWRLVLAAIDESGLPPAAGDPALPEGAALSEGAEVPEGAAVPESRDQLAPGADHTLPAGT